MPETLSQLIRFGDSTPEQDKVADAAPALLAACIAAEAIVTTVAGSVLGADRVREQLFAAIRAAGGVG